MSELVEVIDKAKWDDRTPIIRDAIQAHKEVEQYKIDKMIENGLIHAETGDIVQKRFIAEKTFEIIKDGRFYLVLISILAFISIIFNSSKYWEYNLIKLHKGVEK